MVLEFTPKTYDEIPADKQPSLLEALVPIVGMLLFLSVGMIWLGMDPQIPLLWGIAFAGLFGRYYFGYSWEDLYDGIGRSILTGLQAILILFVIYMLIASWIDSGTIPTLMYYGLEFLSPQIFLPFTVVLSAIVAFAIGSSWTTAGTLGVAMIGIGSGLGIPEAMTAGAVLSGAYTGDKNSPLSDTTNLAAAVTNTELMDHIRAMRPGTLIAFTISLFLFAVLGLNASGTVPVDRIAEIQGGLSSSYVISPLTFLPLVLTFALAFYGFPALPSLGAGIFAGAAISTTVQGVGFAAAWKTIHAGTSPETGVELTNELLSSGGLEGSVWVVSIVVAALALGGILQETGVLAAFAYYIGRAISSVAGLTAGTAVGTVAMNFLAAEQYMAIVVPGMTLQNLYDEYDLESRNLSRAVEAAGTTTSAFVPWGSGGVFMASALGVPVIEYAPYYFFGIISPLVLILMGATGWGIFYKEEPEQDAPEATAASTSSVD
ncbi:arginine/ornithine antiporter ArcD [Halopiger djelfimassiliensis]|uniref:arginine/ornithine antiporter ArcD n=1 Tax=Halopiger djelfimassiliensis TaxID=1293047 RepID=UPI0006778E94|nr:Na+/H+ antiporter NhaC [Halopiger djelfimassiliensis]